MGVHLCALFSWYVLVLGEIMELIANSLIFLSSVSNAFKIYFSDPRHHARY